MVSFKNSEILVHYPSDIASSILLLLLIPEIIYVICITCIKYVTYHSYNPFSSVQFSHSVVSDYLRPHELQHSKPPCPSLTPGVHPNPRPSSQMPSSHFILCRPLFLLLPISPSIRVLSNESTLCTRWPKYWSFSLLPMNTQD